MMLRDVSAAGQSTVDCETAALMGDRNEDKL